MLRYREIRPAEALRQFIDTFWLLEQDAAERSPQRVVPDGRCELILNWGQPFESFGDGGWRRQPDCFLAGQIEGPLLLRPSGPAKMLGVRFHPDGAARWFGGCMHELAGRFTPVDDLSPALAHRIGHSLDHSDPVASVEGAFASCTARAPDVLVAEAVRRIVHAKGASDLAALARELGLSTRQFERRFQAATGLPPKLFCLIQRFSGVFRALEDGSRNWAEVAIRCGYYDQAHLIRDCKRLSGHTPAILLAEDADLARHFCRRSAMSHSSNTRRATTA